jgi:hypothetical protein
MQFLTTGSGSSKGSQRIPIRNLAQNSTATEERKMCFQLLAKRSRFLIGIKKGDEGDAEIHDSQALDLSEVGRGENAPAIKTINVVTWLFKWTIRMV